jgi:uncharacterized protein
MIPSEHQTDLPSGIRPDIQEEIKFSRLLTIVCIVICASGLGLLLWTVAVMDGVRLSLHESRDLERIASRLLGFESRLPELSSLEQMMFRLGGQDGETQKQIRLWYEDLVEDHANSLDELYLGILYGEARLTAPLKQLIADWGKERFPRSLFGRLLEMAYLHHEISAVDDEALQARLAEEVPTSWFYFQLAQRLAERSGDQDLQAHLQTQSEQLTDLPLLKWRVLVIGEMVLLGIGIIFLLRMGFARLTGEISQSTTGFENGRIPWSFQEGVAVLVRGGALTIMVMGIVAVMPDGPKILEVFGMAFLYLPTVILTSILLCRPRNSPLLQVTGLWNFLPRVKSSLSLVFLVVALGLVGDWLIVIGGEAFQSSVHWTEWFVPQLVWGSRMELVKTVTEFVVLAPIFEELIFRGILFATLRKKFNFLTSMMVSGLLFALAHGYGLVAFLTVLWSGFLWSWAYERTGSVIPGILAHAINNGLVVYALVAIFR